MVPGRKAIKFAAAKTTWKCATSAYDVVAHGLQHFVYRKLAIHVIIDLVDSVTYKIYDVIGWRGSTVSVRMLPTVFNT